MLNSPAEERFVNDYCLEWRLLCFEGRQVSWTPLFPDPAMTAFPTACAGLGLLAAVGCAAPVPVAVVERGQRIDHAVLEGFKQGLTTRAEVIGQLGKPSTTSVNPEDGSVTCSWDYFHADGGGSIAIMTILKFGRDDTLQIKMVSQSSQLPGPGVTGSGRPPN